MTVIAVCNQKGGSGKTTMAINLAGAFAAEDKRVLLLDPGPPGQRPGLWVNKSGHDAPGRGGGDRPAAAAASGPCPEKGVRRDRHRLPGQVRRQQFRRDPRCRLRSGAGATQPL